MAARVFLVGVRRPGQAPIIRTVGVAHVGR
jgi:hypothetical protein